jgi:ADP-heptose:LPS heptosyltransferase
VRPATFRTMAAVDPRRILVSRTDRIGDTVLTLPLCGMLKAHFPGVEITYLGRAYTRPVLEASPNVDHVLEWDALVASGDPAAGLRAAGCDLVLHIWPREDIARAARDAGVARRIGTMRRWFHWKYCNELVWVRRHGSPRHEAQLNTLVARRLLGLDDVPSLATLVKNTALVAPPATAATNALVRRDRFTLVMHPLSGGSAARWPLEHFATLAQLLPAERFHIVVTGTTAERETLAPWFAAAPDNVTDGTGLSTGELLALLAASDGMIACPTGPLHLSAALGTRTLGLYPFADTAWEVTRWQPIGPRAEYITPEVPCPDCNRLRGNCTCLIKLSPQRVAAVIERWARDAGR